ncbi:MAG TPA: transglycosylase SLT domain-containing protein [Rhodanobacteraceae bacterium]|jgi:soluble lytic murein transglycosylase|nr:transglycosylase SLT domain-containing protein [Rhodanobacteraceae bacterium]
MNRSFLPRTALRFRFCAAAVAALLGAAPVAQTAVPSLAQQRDAFRAAYTAAQNGQDWRSLAQGLQDYPLYPYLEAAALQHDIKTASPAQIDAYLQRYAGMIPADDLRKAELGWLAQQKDWTDFQHFYQPGLGATLTCDALQADIAQGKPLDFDRDLAALWNQTSAPSACAPVFSAAAAQGLLTPQRVWDRIERAADAGNASTIEQSAQWLAGTDAAEAQRIADALRSPSAFLKKAATFPDTPRTREAVSRALIRLARRDSAQAQTYWQTLSGRFQFDQGERDRVLAALALYNAVDFGPDAVTRLAALPASAQTDATREWRVRAAVAQGDWKAADAAIQALTPDEMQHDEWRYWKARIAQKLGQASAALDGYTALAQQATFYGFLAADQAGLPYSICPQTLATDPAALQQVETDPGMTRAFEFFALDMLPNARREWDRAYADLSPAQQRQAASLASSRGWFDRAVFAFGKSGELQYYALRFPLADKERVIASARNAGIDPAWAFAIIRAETAWQTDARSGADARGLMQLLPGTASLVARRSGLTYDGATSLYDPAINIPLGTQYLANLAMRFNGSPWLASAAYNAGPGNAQRWVDARGNLDPETFILTIPFNETRDYVTRVMSFATLYGWRLHGEPVPISSRLPAIGTPYDPSVDPKRTQVVCRVPAPAPAATAATTGKTSP